MTNKKSMDKNCHMKYREKCEMKKKLKINQTNWSSRQVFIFLRYIRKFKFLRIYIKSTAISTALYHSVLIPSV